MQLLNTSGEGLGRLKLRGKGKVTEQWLLAEPLEAAGASRIACKECGLCGNGVGYEKPLVPENWTKRLLLIIEGRRWLDEYKVSLRRVLDKAGYSGSDVAVYFATRSSSHIEATMRQLRACRPFLLAVIEELKPRSVLLLGDKALHSVLNKGNISVTRARGRLLEMPGLPGYLQTVSDCSKLGNPLLLESIPHIYCSYDPLQSNEGFVQTDLQRNWVKTDWPADELPKDKTVGFDTEYYGTEFLTLGIADEVHAKALEGFEVGKALPILQSATWLVGHSVFEDIAWLRRAGMVVRREWIDGSKVLDSLLLARMDDENQQEYKLETALLNCIFTNPWKDKTENYLADMRGCPPVLRMERCRLDAWAARVLAAKTYYKLDSKLVNFTHRIAAALYRVSLAGAFVDLEKHFLISSELKKKTLALEDQLREAAIQVGMTEFTPTNDGHLRELFYERLGCKPSKWTGKKDLPAVDQITLKLLNHPTANLLLEFNHLDKLNSVQGEGLSKFILPLGSLGYVQFRHNPLGARTGRRSSSEPNSQNWPGPMRQIIRSRWPGGSIGDFDYKSLEPVIIAWDAQDEKLMNAFSKGRGYLDVAEEVLGITVKKGTKPYVAVKSIVNGVHYNMQTKKMADDLWRRLNVHFSEDFKEHVKETGRLRGVYLEKYPGLRVYMARQEERVLKYNLIHSVTGRTRRLPLPEGRHTTGFGHAVNQAINFRVQSLASDITGSAVIDVEAAILADLGISLEEYYDLLLELQRKYLTADPLSSIILPTIPITFIINEVHDDLVIDFHPDLVKKHTELIVETMRAVPTIRKLWPITKEIPLRVDPSISPFWGEGKE